jgi:hypothetical protein
MRFMVGAAVASTSLWLLMRDNVHETSHAHLRRITEASLLRMLCKVLLFIAIQAIGCRQHLPDGTFVILPILLFDERLLRLSIPIQR